MEEVKKIYSGASNQQQIFNHTIKGKIPLLSV